MARVLDEEIIHVAHSHDADPAPSIDPGEVHDGTQVRVHWVCSCGTKFTTVWTRQTERRRSTLRAFWFRTSYHLT
jgi:hypothetical protein